MPTIERSTGHGITDFGLHPFSKTLTTVMMSQKSSLLPPREFVSKALMPNKACHLQWSRSR
jgi:hypothetical protein